MMKPVLNFLLILFISVNLTECGQSHSQKPEHSIEKSSHSLKTDLIQTIEPIEVKRDIIVEKLRVKIRDNKPLVVHILTPLCDNRHQGIVPVADHLGKGRDLKGNLYWGCGHGMKAYFKNRHGWKHVQSDSMDGKVILEQSIFYRELSNGARVYLVSDAYAGDQMKACLEDYFSYLSDTSGKILMVEQDSVSIGGKADMIGFNGHNGLMDMSIDYVNKRTSEPKDAVSISCYSSSYFSDHYKMTGSYPLVNTTGSLYPGAFIFNAFSSGHN